MAQTYCPRCHARVPAHSNFCSECGCSVVQPTPVTAPLPRASQSTPGYSGPAPLLELRPRFLGWPAAATTIPIQLFMTVWAGGFCGGFSTLGIKGVEPYLGFKIHPAAPFVFWACAAFFGIPFWSCFGKRRSYARTTYRLFPDRVEITSGLLTLQHRVIPMTALQEVILQQGPVQRRNNLGTLVLVTNAAGVSAVHITGHSWNSRPASIGLATLQDVENPAVLQQRIQDLIQQANRPAK